MLGDIQIRAERELWGRSIELLIFSENQDKSRISIAKPQDLVPEELEPGHHATQATLTLTQKHAQALMDNLWNCGLRPSEGTGSAGSLAATERHLKDMQEITMKLLEEFITVKNL
jgi:hypothetical protein